MWQSYLKGKSYKYYCTNANLLCEYKQLLMSCPCCLERSCTVRSKLLGFAVILNIFHYCEDCHYTFQCVILTQKKKVSV